MYELLETVPCWTLYVEMPRLASQSRRSSQLVSDSPDGPWDVFESQPVDDNLKLV